MGIVKEKGRNFLFELVYQLHRKGIIKNKLRVNSVDETIDDLLCSEDSFIRFGDAEIRIIEGHTTKFQDYDEALGERLREIIQYKQKHVRVAISDIFDSLDLYTEKSKKFWKEHLFFSRKTYLKYCDQSKVYENTFFSRPYYSFRDKEQAGRWFERIKEIWKDRNVVIVEGEGTHMGVGNDLLDTVASAERILCPSLNAYRCYPSIKEACLTFSKEKLFLFALGNTAKLLVSDLAKEGYRAIDIGNLDMEYEWYLNKDDKKGEVKKHSIVGVEANKEAGYDVYLSQVKKRIV